MMMQYQLLSIKLVSVFCMTLIPTFPLFAIRNSQDYVLANKILVESTASWSLALWFPLFLKCVIGA